jgi:NADH dehydrogenase
MAQATLPQVVIVGAGFGGLEAARKLAKAPVRITLIDRNNYHLFQPLLYQVAIAGLSPAQIAHPVRAILRRQRNLSFLMGNVTGVDFSARQVILDQGSLDYDYLILAAGGRTNFFGLKQLEQRALPLKDIDDAVTIRNHLLSRFEAANREADPQARRAQLTFVVVGGGPTGVETAGALSELIHLVLRKDYPNLDLSQVQVILLEASNHLMGNYPRDLQAATLRLLRRKQVEVRLNAALSDYNGQRVRLTGGASIPARTLIWTAGVRAAGLIDRLGLPQAQAGRVPVEPGLQLPGRPRVYAIGDAAYLEDDRGQPLPMLATVALQQAQAAAQNLLRDLRGQRPRPFHYKDPGLLATIGRNAAVAQLWGLTFSGFPAWVIWVGLHIFRIIGFRNRLLVLINWAWDYFFYDSAVRLITAE